jgi:hypothetical protein
MLRSFERKPKWNVADSLEHCTSEREDVREGIGAEKRMTATVCQAKPAFAKATAGDGEKVG